MLNVRERLNCFEGTTGLEVVELGQVVVAGLSVVDGLSVQIQTTINTKVSK